jgi:CysZ protein
LSFGDGIRAFTDALGLLGAAGIARFVWLPVLIALLVIGSTLVWVFGHLDAGVAWVMTQLPGWLAFLEWIVAPLAYLLVVLLAAYLFGYVATIVASPFLGLLSARVQLQETGQAPVSTLGPVALVGTTLARELRKFGYFLPRAVLVFLFTLLPVVNVAAPFVWFAFGAWTMAIQFIDYAPENADMAFKQTLAALKANRSAALGFGAPTALAMAIPLVNVLAVPVAVIGGTLLWCRLRQSAAQQ